MSLVAKRSGDGKVSIEFSGGHAIMIYAGLFFSGLFVGWILF